MIVDATKTCKVCGLTKPTSQFYKAYVAKKSGKVSYRSDCKACTRVRNDAWNAANPERFERWKRSSHLRKRYGITIEQYEAMLVAQDGGCAVCGADSPRSSRDRWFHVDHDHACCPGQTSCGECVRGLLCAPCNWRLGYIEDATWLASAFDYLGVAA